MSEKLRKLLQTIPGFYYDFELGVMVLLKGNEPAMAELIQYIEETPDAGTGDIIEYAYDLSDYSKEDDADE